MNKIIKFIDDKEKQIIIEHNLLNDSIIYVGQCRVKGQWVSFVVEEVPYNESFRSINENHIIVSLTRISNTLDDRIKRYHALHDLLASINFIEVPD